MKLVVHQNIVIHQLRVEAITNSSILQIGSAGLIKPLTNLYNTGGFSGPAPELTEGIKEISFVPLPPPA